MQRSAGGGAADFGVARLISDRSVWLRQNLRRTHPSRSGSTARPWYRKRLHGVRCGAQNVTRVCCVVMPCSSRQKRSSTHLRHAPDAAVNRPDDSCVAARTPAARKLLSQMSAAMPKDGGMARGIAGGDKARFVHDGQALEPGRSPRTGAGAHAATAMAEILWVRSRMRLHEVLRSG
jgi:hypothetical protein